MGIWTAMIFTALAVFLHNFGFSSSQSFIEHPQKQRSITGNTVTFYCQATGLVNTTYYWLKDGNNVTRGNSGVNSKAYLTISNLIFGDAGLYSCRASSNTISITSNQARLSVRGTPVLAQPPLGQSPHVGQTATFTCNVIGDPTPIIIAWYYNNNLLSNGGRISIFENGTLIISNVRKSDAGIYKLEAGNYLGHTYAFVDLTVLDPPSVPYFTTIPQNKTAKESNDVAFYCAASGSPTPILKWIRLDGVIPSDRRFQPRPGALRLTALVPSDDGVYACVANNTQGERRAIVYLRIKGFPRFTISPSTKEVKENESVTFDCAATSEPSPTIKWLSPTGTTITSLSMPSGNVRVLSNDTLVIDKVAEDLGGIYTCVATNSLGSKRQEAELSVLFAPRFASLLQNITKTRGQELTITCPARGNPAPEFQWTFGGKIIQNQQKLTIPALTVGDQGYYVCRGNNSMGVASSTFYLRIYTLPNIITAPTDVTIGNNATAMFHCQAQGDPTPSVTWLKSGVVIGSSGRFSILPNGTLSITKATVSDQGLFSCRAENAAGRDEKKAYLVVTDPPKFTEFPSNKTVNIETQVTLQCKAVAQDTPSITWYKVANDGTRQQVTSAVTLPSGYLSFSSVKRGDRSMYACRACNAAGCKTTPNVMLNVLYGPVFAVPPKDVGVLQGQDAVLKCEPDSSPKAQITWRRPNGEMIQGTGYEQIIRNVQPGDTGEYTCTASNPYGVTSEVKIKLEIQTKPVILNLEKEENNLKTTVSCNVEGKPAPSIVWYLEKERLPLYDYDVTRDKKLVVPIGSLENKTFLCNASNQQGFDVYFAKVPERPSSLSISEIKSHSLRVTWVRPSPPEFLIKHYLLEVWSAVSSSWQSLNSSIEGTFYDVTQLIPFMTYMFRVKAANGLGTSKIWRTSENVTTLSYKPSTPRDLSLSVQSAYVINVTWSVPQVLNGPLDDLQYHVTYEPKLPNFTNKYDVKHDPNVGTQGYLLVDLEPDLRYTVHVVAWRRRSDGTKLESNAVTTTARTLQLVPTSPPIGLVVEASGPNRILVKWKKPPYSVSGYNIWYRESKPGMTHKKVHIPDGSATTYLIMKLAENTEYQVKVQMYSNVGEGPFSKYYDVRTFIDAFLAGQNQEDKGTNWEVAVGGLVSGLLLLLIVIGIVWCLRRRSQQSNQTFRVSTRRRGTHSDFPPSSVESDGTVEGQYNVAYNHELDHNLDIDMFSDDENAITTPHSYRNERAIQYLSSSQLDFNMGHRGDSSEPVYANLPRNRPSDTEGNTNDVRGSDVAVDNRRTIGRRDVSGRDSNDVHERAPVNNGHRGDSSEPVYANLPRNGPSDTEGNSNDVRGSDVAVDNTRTIGEGDVSGRDSNDVHERAPINNGPRGDSSEADYATLPRNDPSNAEGNSNDVRGSDVAVDNTRTNERGDVSGRDPIDVHERAPVNNNPDKPDVGIPVYAMVDMSKKKKNRKTSDGSVFDQHPTIELDHNDNMDEGDISEVPYPEEELPPLQRTWTNVSEFNFPPPPSDPPPNNPAVPNADGAGMEPTNNGRISYEGPYEEVTTKNPIDKEPEGPKDKGPKKRRMVASWAEDEDEDEPIVDLWEVVDKELDRRLGYT